MQPAGPVADASRARPLALRVPLPVWIVAGVVALHLLFFWLVADKHYLPKARYIPPVPTPNFAARRTTTVDPQTGEVTMRSDFVISTKFATPPSTVRPTASP